MEGFDVLDPREHRRFPMGRYLPILVGILSLCPGCKTSSTPITNAPSQKDLVISKPIDYDDGPIEMKPETFVVFANMRAQGAREKAVSQQPLIQQAYRDQARRAYQHAIEMDAACRDAYIGLARLYLDLDQYDRAMETYEKIVKINPKDSSLWFEQGMAQAKHKDLDGAIASLQAAVEHDPENQHYVNALGYALARRGRFDESYTCFEKEMGTAKAHYNVARMLYQVERDEECKQHLQLALQAKPDLQEAQQFLTELQTPAAAALAIQSTYGK